MQALVDALRDPDRAIPAAVAILDRGYGRPLQAIYAQVNGNVVVGGGIDAPPRETIEQWLERRRKTLAALDGPRPASVPGETAQPPPAPPSSPPNGEHPPIKPEAGSARAPAREMTPQERD
jgi:hypothetical protein